MKREMARRVLARHPDDTFVYADDALRLTRSEVARMVAGVVIAAVVIWLFLCVLALAGPAPTP